MKAFITGGTRFIGSRLALAIQESGHTVQLLGLNIRLTEQNCTVEHF